MAMSQNSFVASLLGGAAAGICADITLYPLDTIKTRLQSAEGFVASGAFRGVYHGLLSAAAGSAPCAATFFATYEWTKHSLEYRLPTEMAPVCHMIAASAGEATTGAVRMPFEVVKQRMQTDAKLSTSRCIRQILSTDGVAGFFRGYTSLVAREIPFSLLQFPLYEGFKRLWASYDGVPVHQLDGVKVALVGSVAGGIAAGITTPLDVVKTRILLKQGEASTIQVLREIYTKEGLRALFSGLGPRVAWISLGGAIFFGSYEKARRFVYASLASAEDEAETTG